jgi:hypothetical protein
MYLVVSSLGIFYILAKSLEQFKNYSFIIFAFSIAWFFSAYKTLSFTQVNHWIVNEQAISRSYVKFFKEIAPNPPTGSIFLFRPADLSFSQKNKFVLVETEDNIRQSLNDQDAPQAIYNDSNLKSIYAKAQDKPILPSNHQIFEIIPRAND